MATNKIHLQNAEKAARQELGDAWKFLGPKIREAFICKHVLNTISARDGVEEYELAAKFAYEGILHAAESSQDSIV